ncbi:head-tail adaptor protein [Maritimibacter sp. DP1N21-5]|uniref:head-tail adaptor protein n=1 Tax=Maritimibacter sp. DP1N21-5 TaxID=2836867 RepID=UPI001C458204|nr:head-tail adaptor protein [Maritimibacter sp. DP1N21-5]MBV7410170.1 head-tail adaptor protein [Maritimibacter sp. DP1N21-5]
MSAVAKRPVLKRKLVLEKRHLSPDGAGGYTTGWSVVGTLWAEIKAGTGRERAVEAMTLSSIPWRITLRAAPMGSSRRPRPDQRLRSGTRVFVIVAVADADPSAGYLTCFAREEVSS